MNYGHTNLPDNSLDFPTPDNFEVNNNLDSTNPEISWNQPASIEHDKKSLGSEALANSALANSLEMPPSPEQELVKPVPYTTNLEPISQPVEDTTTDADIAKKALEVKPESIKTTEYLNDEGIKAIDNLNEQFMRDEIDIEHYYDQHQDIVETNLLNSFGRIVGEGKEKAA